VTGTTDFFISYTRADRAWAEWIAWQLEDAGYSVVVQAWDFRPGANFVLEMQRAAASAQRTIAVLSPEYLTSGFTQPEWAAAFARDPGGTHGYLLPVRVRPCALEGLLPQIIYVDLVDLDESAARRALLAGVQPGRGKPARPPAFPGTTPRSAAAPPQFPGPPPSAGAAAVPSGAPVSPAARPGHSAAARSPAQRPGGTGTRPARRGRAPRAVILTALPVEYQAVRAHLRDVRSEVHPQGTVYERGAFHPPAGPAWEVLICETGPRNVPAALLTAQALGYFRPRVLLFVGIAGGIKDVRLGDVVAATRVYGYESGKEAPSGFQPRPDVARSSFRMEQRARAEARQSDWLRRLEGPVADPPPRAVVEPVAAGEKVVAARRAATYRFLRANYGDAVAVEMEGRGFLEAAHIAPQVDALLVRGLSDLLRAKRAADRQGWPATAARHASAFAFEVLAKLGTSRPEQGRRTHRTPDAGTAPPSPPPEIQGRVAQEPQRSQLREAIEDLLGTTIPMIVTEPSQTGAVVYFPDASGVLRPTFSHNQRQPLHALPSFEKWQGCTGDAWGRGRQVIADLTQATPDVLAREWKLLPEQIAATAALKVVVSTPIWTPGVPPRPIGIVSIDSTLPAEASGLTSDAALKTAANLAGLVARIVELAGVRPEDLPPRR
jgi:nucleoside phosphorylase